MEITAAGLILKYLEAEIIEYICSLPGNSVVPLFAAMSEKNDIAPLLARYWEEMAYMAGGHARVNGEIGVCYATSGSGVTSLNNAKLGSVHELQQFRLVGNIVLTTLEQVNITKTAKSLDAQGYRIGKSGELLKILLQDLKSRKPTAVDCIIDVVEVLPLRR